MKNSMQWSWNGCIANLVLGKFFNINNLSKLSNKNKLGQYSVHIYSLSFHRKLFGNSATEECVVLHYKAKMNCF